MPSRSSLPSVTGRENYSRHVVLAEGGDLRVAIRRAHQRSTLFWSAAALIVAPLVLLTPPSVGASSTHAPTRVPNVLHESKAQVNVAMAAAGLFFRTDGPGSADGTWRSAVAENPQPGTVVAWNATIIVATSLAAPVVRTHAPTRVPNVLHESKAKVYVAMAAAGLFFVTHGPGSADGTWTSALAQSPVAGTLVAWHATVSLSTTRLPGANLQYHAPTRVPHLVGLSRPRALAELLQWGLRVRTRGPGSANNTWTTVVAQNLRPGTRVAWHSVVLVTTRRGAARPPAAVNSSATPVASTPTTTTTTTTSASSGRTRMGLATWYAYFPGRCATSYLPKGTVITVRDVATGRTIRCEVTDHQAKSPGRVVDLSETQFRQLAPLWRGVVFVEVTW